MNVYTHICYKFKKTNTIYECLYYKMEDKYIKDLYNDVSTTHKRIMTQTFTNMNNGKTFISKKAHFYIDYI